MRSGSGPPGNNTVLSGSSARPAGGMRLTPAPLLGGVGGAFELREQLAVQTAEAAVAHDEQVVSGARRAGEIARQRVDVAAGVSALAERGEHPAGVPAQIRRRVQPHLVRGVLAAL